MPPLIQYYTNISIDVKQLYTAKMYIAPITSSPFKGGCIEKDLFPFPLTSTVFFVIS